MDLYPYGYHSEEVGGKPYGMNVDPWEDISKHMGLRTKYVHVKVRGINHRVSDDEATQQQPQRQQTVTRNATTLYRSGPVR